MNPIPDTTSTRNLVVALGLALIASGLLFLFEKPYAPLVLVGGLGAGAFGYYLIQRPLTALCIAIMLQLAPKWVRVEGLFDLVLHATTALALAAWVFNTVSLGKPVRWNAICIFILLYIGWAAMSVLWAPDIIQSRRKIIVYIIGFTITFLISNQIKSVGALDALMRALRWNGWIYAVGGIYSFLFTDYQFGERLKALGENENGLGLMLIVMLPGVIWPVIRSKGEWRRRYMLLSVLYILVMLFLIALSGSRGTSISVALVLLAFWFMRQMRPWGLVGVLIVIAGLAAAPFMLETLSRRFQDSELSGVGGRTELWQASILLIRDHPWTGVGIGNGPDELPLYIPEVTSDHFKNDQVRYPSHNPVFEATVETGLPGMLIYLSICGSALLQLYRSRRHPALQQGAMAAYVPLIFGVAVGFFASWVKAGGIEATPMYFIMLCLLIIPSQFPQRIWKLSRARFRIALRPLS